jgi:hypothetical protein
VTGTISLTSGQMNINGPLTINGPGAASLAISANFNSRIFSIFENVADVCATPGTDFPVSISGLKLFDGRRATDQPGGAIYSEKTLTLSGVEVSDSRAKSGGGLAVLTLCGPVAHDQQSIRANTARPFARRLAAFERSAVGCSFRSDALASPPPTWPLASPTACSSAT